MSYAYGLTVIDDQGEVVLEIALTPDQCMPIVAAHIAAIKERQAVEETATEIVVEDRAAKRSYKKREGGGNQGSVKTGERRSVPRVRIERSASFQDMLSKRSLHAEGYRRRGSGPHRPEGIDRGAIRRPSRRHARPGIPKRAILASEQAAAQGSERRDPQLRL